MNELCQKLSDPHTAELGEVEEACQTLETRETLGGGKCSVMETPGRDVSKRIFKGTHDRFQTDLRYRDAQLKAGRIEEKCIEMDELAQNDFTCRPSTNGIRRLLHPVHHGGSGMTTGGAHKFMKVAQRLVLVRLPVEDRMGVDAWKIGLLKKSMAQGTQHTSGSVIGKGMPEAEDINLGSV